MKAMDELFRVLKVVMLTAFGAIWLYLMWGIVSSFVQACVSAAKASRTGKDKVQ